MKNKYLLIIMSLVFFSCQKREVKTILKYDNEEIVGIERYDENGKILLKKECQFIEDWGEYLTFITGYKYQENLKTEEYYVHSNIEVRKIDFFYSKDSLKSKKCKVLVSQSFSNRKRNAFMDVFSIDSLKRLIEYVETKTDTISTYDCSRINKSKDTELYVTEREKTKVEKVDSLGNKVITTYESWRNPNDYQMIEKYSNDLLIELEKITPYQHSKEVFNYNSNRELIEEIDFLDLTQNKFQKKIHSYRKGKIVKTLFYHGEDLAFIYEYQYYRNGNIKSERKERISKNKHFSDRRKVEKYNFEYEYY